MAKGYHISAVVLSRNSEKEIGRCLASLKGWADEVILVDGQSTDRTLAIAKDAGAKAYSHEFLGAFAKERNFGTDIAQGEWVLQLDSDEVVTEQFKQKCDEVLPSTQCVAFKFKRKNIFLGHEFLHGGWYHWSQHLFKKGCASYEGRVHERMIVGKEVGTLDADIRHYPFASITQFLQRQNRYTDLQAQDIIDAAKELSLKAVRYQLTVKSMKLFRKIFFKKRGYKEGVYGYIFAMLNVFVHFLKWAKVWEKVCKTQ